MKRIRVLMVPESLVWVGAIAYLLMLGTNWLEFRTFSPAPSTEDGLNVLWFRIVLCVVMGLAGFARAKQFHPALNMKYAQWLAATPWHSPQHLPLGPVHLVWRDLPLLVAVFLIDRLHLHLTGVLPIIVFLLCYLIMMFGVLSATGQGRVLAILLIILPFALLFLSSERAVLAVMVVGYAIATIGLYRGLQHFPWKLLTHARKDDPGWPATSLGPVDPKPQVPALFGIYISALLGWWTYCIAFNSEFPARSDLRDRLAIVAFLVGLLIASFRLIIYTQQGRPPISALGRLFTRKLLIPAYDRVFLGPLGVLAGAILASVVVATNINLPLACGIGVFLIFTPSFVIGPSLGIWKLTGAFSMTRPRNLPASNHRRSTARIDISPLIVNP